MMHDARDGEIRVDDGQTREAYLAFRLRDMSFFGILIIVMFHFISKMKVIIVYSNT